MSFKVGIIGLGKMGQCIVQGLLESHKLQPNQVWFTTKHTETTQSAKDKFSIQPAKDNRHLVEQSDVIILAVKPQNMEEVLGEIKSKIKPGHTVISIVASVETSAIEKILGNKVAVVRAMPNTPAFVRAGITAACVGKQVKEKDWEKVEAIFKPLGQLVKVDERHMDAVTGLSGCGPAYIYMVLESLSDGGIKVGLPRELATQLAAHTVLGAAKMLLETGKHPAYLKDEVTTPAGCTIDGLMELEEGKLRVTLIKAVVQATERAKSLSKGSKS